MPCRLLAASFGRAGPTSRHSILATAQRAACMRARCSYARRAIRQPRPRPACQASYQQAAQAKELPDKRRYGVIGSGALGGFYGAMLQQAGQEVHFLMHSGFEQVKQDGFRVNSVLGDFALPQVNAYQARSDMPPCDVVLLATKTTSNHLLPDLLPPVFKPGGVVVVMQNGLGVEPQVAQLVGEDSVMGAGCFLCSNKLAPGVIHHIDYGDIVLGEYNPSYGPGPITRRMQQVAGDFEAAGIRVTLEQDLFIARWKKLMWNVPYNGTCALLSASTDQLMANPHTAALVRDLVQETVAAAEATARHLTPALPPRRIPEGFAQYIMDFTAAMRPYKPSMLLDHAAGRPMEIEAVYGAPLKLAAEAGCPVPRITMLHQQLQFLDSRRSAGASSHQPGRVAEAMPQS